LFMEPFAPAYGLFPEFPDQGFFLELSPPAITRLLREESFARLLRRKHLLSPRSIQSPAVFRLERGVARLVARYSRYLSSRIQQRAAQFSLVNMNRFENSYPLYPKISNPPHWVVKELRFAGKIPVLRAAFPEASYLVVLRSPHATVHSMLRWFHKGRLGEVKRELESFVEKLACQRIGEEYASQIRTARAGTTAHRAALYWRACYEQMLGALEREHSRFLLLPYEALASSPQAQAKEVFDWAGIPWSASVGNYLDYSTRSEVQNPSATNTVRQSGGYYASWQAKSAPEVRQAVDEVVEGSRLLDVIAPFYDQAPHHNAGCESSLPDSR
jgi:hypothetical protein